MRPDSDRQTERSRYDHAGKALAEGLRAGQPMDTLRNSPACLLPPYERYHALIQQLAAPDIRALEIGAGSGLHTEVVAATGAAIVALDVSAESLKVCQIRAPGVHPVCADMAALPFADQSFDILLSAGSLSYGDPDAVNAEIWRVLRPGATLLVVDSLNHNPVYRLNRWISYRRGLRTRSTVQRMPTVARIDQLRAPFRQSSVEYFGKWLFLHSPIARLRGTDQADKSVRALEGLGPDRLAFKVVVCATDFDPSRVVTS